MNRVIISGSAKLQDSINHWVGHFEALGYDVLDRPKLIAQENRKSKLPEVFRSFYKHIEQTDIFFLINENKDNMEGYIGAGATAEITYAIIQNLVHGKNIRTYILNKPSEKVPCYDEVQFWLEMGWASIYDT